jgi:hypothetical protein
MVASFAASLPGLVISRKPNALTAVVRCRGVSSDGGRRLSSTSEHRLLRRGFGIATHH